MVQRTITTCSPHLVCMRLRMRRAAPGLKAHALLPASLAAIMLIFGLGSASAQVPAPRIAAPQTPLEAAAMVESAVRAVNLHRPEALTPFSASGDAGTFAWTASKNHDWKGDVLPVPADTAQAPLFLAVFHSFHTCESDGDHVYPLVRMTTANGQTWALGAEIAETATLGLRVRDHAIDARIDVPGKTATFRDTIIVERVDAPSGGGGRAGFGLLRISEDFRVRSLRISGSPEAAPYVQAGGVIAFVPPAGERFSVSLEYSGKLNHRNGDFIHDDEAVIASYWYPHIARLPATLSLTATAPAQWTCIAQGEPTATRLNADGTRTFAWRNDLPTSFFTLDMGRYHVTTRQWNGRLLSAYLLQGSPDAEARTARATLDLLQESLSFFEGAFGAFPYHRYAVVETRGPFNGALEAYSFATFGPQTLPDYIPHELAHTWWGGVVPCTYTRSMWNEAFANYSDDLFQRARASGRKATNSSSAATAQRLELRKQAFRGYSAMSVAQAFDTDDDPQNAVGYGKGAQVLRVLEEQIGQEAMLKAIRAFITRHVRGEAAEWPEFESAVVQATGQDLRWFFAQWLERTGVPRAAITDVVARSAGSEQWVDGHIRQYGPVYRLKLPVLVELKSGGSIRQTVETQEADIAFHIRLPGAPDRLRLDPDAIVPLSPAMTGQAKGAPFTYVFP